MDVAWRAVAAFLTSQGKIPGSENGSEVMPRTRDQKISGSSPGRSGGRISSPIFVVVVVVVVCCFCFVCFLFLFCFFFSRINFCSDSYFGIRSTPVVPQ